MTKLCLILLMFTGFSCTKKIEPKFGVNERLKEKAILARTYCEKNNMDIDLCILVDMKIHSGKKRFFLWDFKGDSILKSGMCSNGSCSNLEKYTTTKVEFSNVPNSHCSSLGKYKLGKRGYSTFGINVNYKLYQINFIKRYILCIFKVWEKYLKSRLKRVYQR